MQANRRARGGAGGRAVARGAEGGGGAWGGHDIFSYNCVRVIAKPIYSIIILLVFCLKWGERGCGCGVKREGRRGRGFSY